MSGYLGPAFSWKILFSASGGAVREGQPLGLWLVLRILALAFPLPLAPLTFPISRPLTTVPLSEKERVKYAKALFSSFLFIRKPFKDCC